MTGLSITDALAHLQRTPRAHQDREIAAAATQRLRAWGLTGPHDAVSRSLVNTVRHGATPSRKGLKVQAIWEAFHAFGMIPAVPREVQEWARSAPRRDRGPASVSYWRHKYYALKTQHGPGREEVKEIPMLTGDILKYFGLTQNPVFDEIHGTRDIWWGRQHREAKAILIDAATSGRFVRLAGARGAGKSLVANAVKEELARREDLILVEPSPTITGVLTEMHLITAVIQAIKRKLDGRDELFTEAASPTKRALAMRYLLVQQRKANRRVALWIDEAHELKPGTYLGLKRFLDEVDGIGRRLLGILLIGQNPDAVYNPRARDLSEVTMRLQTYKLQPMQDELPDYLRWKLERAGARPGDVITPAALRAVASRCLYPLDANVLLSELLIQAFAAKEKPIGREQVETARPEDLEPATAAGA